MLDKTQMYSLAYAFHEEDPWKVLGSAVIFAVQHEDSEISYCTILAKDDDKSNHLMHVFTGSEELATFYRFIDLTFREKDEDAFLLGEFSNSLKSLTCYFCDLDSVPDRQKPEIQNYAKALGIDIRPPRKCVQFCNYLPGYFLWPIETERQLTIMCDALKAGIALSHLRRDNQLPDWEMDSFGPGTNIPLLIQKGEEWNVKMTVLPDAHFSYPSPLFTNNSLQTKIRNLRKKDTWQCGMFYLPVPESDPDGPKRPYYPMVMLAVSETASASTTVHAGNIQEDPLSFLTALADLMLEEEKCPKLIRCGDIRTYRLLHDFCNRTGIRIERKGDTTLISDAEKDYLIHLLDDDKDDDRDGDETAENSDEHIRHLVDHFNSMSDQEIRNLPRHIKASLMSMISNPQVPTDFVRRLHRIFTRL